MKDGVLDFLTLVSVGYVAGFIFGHRYFDEYCEIEDFEGEFSENSDKYKNDRELVYRVVL